MKAITIISTLVIFVILNICRASEIAEPNKKEIQLSAEKMQELKQAYDKLQQSIEHFLEVNRNAEKQHPGLAAVETCLLRKRPMENLGDSEYNEYQTFYNASDENKRLFDLCRLPFGAKFYADAMKDPNWAEELKPILLLQYRIEDEYPPEVQRETFMERLKKRGLTVFEPNDPNDERLWNNIKRHVQENSDYYEQQRTNLVEEKGVPKKVAEFAGYLTYNNMIIRLSGPWLLINTPEEVIDALREMMEKMKEIMSIYPQWIQIEHLLTDKNVDVDEKKAVAFFKEYPYGQVRKFLSGQSNIISEAEGLNNKMLAPLMHELIYVMLDVFHK